MNLKYHGKKNFSTSYNLVNDVCFYTYNNYYIVSNWNTGQLIIYTLDMIKNKQFDKPFLIKTPIKEAEMVIDDKNYFANCLNKDYFNDAPPIINLNKIEFSVNNQKQEADNKHLTIPHDFSNLDFFFDAISLSQPEYNESKYRMIGFDTTWQTISDDKIRFSTLQPGSYTLQIKACNNHQYWSDPYEFSFSIAYPWYRSWAAYAGYLLLGAGSIYGFVKSRTRKLEAEKH